MTQKSEICDHFLGKNKIFEIFASILTRFFFRNSKFSKVFYTTPQIHTLHTLDALFIGHVPKGFKLNLVRFVGFGRNGRDFHAID